MPFVDLASSLGASNAWRWQTTSRMNAWTSRPTLVLAGITWSVFWTAALFRGYPRAARTDNGLEVTCRAFITWAQNHGIQHIFIVPGSPTQNAHIKSFNGTFQDECLNENWFKSSKQVRLAIATLRLDYNETRPHSSCRCTPPATFAALSRQLTGDSTHCNTARLTKS